MRRFKKRYTVKQNLQKLAKNRETDFLQLGKFSEKDLYKNLDWIAKHQHRIENDLYKRRHGDKPCKLFLYDVT
jgi:hypothetical protein